jgi:hypothetical protein
MIACPHASVHRPGVIRCAAGCFGGLPAEAVCRLCLAGRVRPSGHKLPSSPPEPAFLAGRLRECQTCPHRPSCAVWTFGDCHGRAYLNRPLACCPLDEPRWKPEGRVQSG